MVILGSWLVFSSVGIFGIGIGGVSLGFEDWLDVFFLVVCLFFFVLLRLVRILYGNFRFMGFVFFF